MRSLISIPVALLLAVAAQGRSVQHGPVEPLDVDVQVVGHSSSQMDAARYNVQVQAGDDVPTVTLPGLGELQGTTSITDLSKRTVFSYLGVPFGEAPVGELRFKAPVPKKPWTPTVWNATVPGKVCYQFSASSSAKRRRRDTWPVTDDQQSEDCLVLDVHTPKVDPSAKLPVLVFVHGGSFQTGYAGQKPPTALLDEADIVLVSPQYRLGALGFLNLQTEEVPGNAGLLDLVLALRWVHDNIEHFGGDPSRVTIAGHSAGAASASVLYLSHLTKGLIHGVMPMSGSALGFWAWDRTPEAGAEQITSLVCIGVPNTPEDRLKCLREAEPQVIVQRFLMYAGLSLLQGHLGMSGSIPSLQKAGSDDTKVLLDLPENILSSPNLVALPYMTGVTKHEGTFPLELAESYYLKPTHLESNSSFLRNDVIHVLLQVIGNDDPAGYVSDTTLQAFFDLASLGDYQAMRDGLIDMMGAFGFKSPARRIVERNSELGQPSYLYAFNHNGIYSQNSPEGIYHGADQPYIFPLPKYPTLAGADLEISKVMRKYITNFVIYQNPTPEESQVANSPTWKKYVRDQEDYLELVWPPTARQWFHNEMTVARRDQFNEGGVKVTSTAPASSKAPASSTAPASSNTSSRSSDQTSRTTDGSGAASTVPSLALALCLAVLAVMCAKA